MLVDENVCAEKLPAFCMVKLLNRIDGGELLFIFINFQELRKFVVVLFFFCCG